MSNTPITDKTPFNIFDLQKVARRLERERSELIGALTGMCESFENNEYPGGKKQRLHETRALLAKFK